MQIKKGKIGFSELICHSQESQLILKQCDSGGVWTTARMHDCWINNLRRHWFNIESLFFSDYMYSLVHFVRCTSFLLTDSTRHFSHLVLRLLPSTIMLYEQSRMQRLKLHVVNQVAHLLPKYPRGAKLRAVWTPTTTKKPHRAEKMFICD